MEVVQKHCASTHGLPAKAPLGIFSLRVYTSGMEEEMNQLQQSVKRAFLRSFFLIQ